jgi:hypothetical protein
MPILHSAPSAMSLFYTTRRGSHVSYTRHTIAATAILLAAFGAGAVGAAPIAAASPVPGVVKEAPSPAQLVS